MKTKVNIRKGRAWGTEKWLLPTNAQLYIDVSTCASVKRPFLSAHGELYWNWTLKSPSDKMWHYTPRNKKQYILTWPFNICHYWKKKPFGTVFLLVHSGVRFIHLWLWLLSVLQLYVLFVKEGKIIWGAVATPNPQGISTRGPPPVTLKL